MMCDCQFDPGRCVSLSLPMSSLSLSENDEPSEACGENCLNRLLMIEW